MEFKFNVGDKINICEAVNNPEQKVGTTLYTISDRYVDGNGDNRYKVKENWRYNLIEGIVRFNKSSGCKHSCKVCNGKCDLWEEA